jgi:hypothetical protein
VGTNTTRITLTLGRRQAMLAAVLTGAAILLFRNWLEADMARHMLIEFPLLLVAGLGTAKALPERAVALIMRSNQLGLAGFTFVSLTAAYWMTATVGLLYQNAPQQLCVNYLIGTQLSAGEGLVAAAVAIAALWCVYAVPAYLDMTRCCRRHGNPREDL